MDISVVILNYKTKGLTLNCIRSIKESDFQGLKHEIIVVDNNSNDYLGEILNWQHPEVHFIQNEVNSGFGAGNNLGLRKSAGSYVVIMNPDTQAFPNTFKAMHAFMESNPDVGVAGPRQLNPDRSAQDSCYRFHSPLTPIYRRTPLGKLKHAQRDIDRLLMKDVIKDRTMDVDWLLGSFLFCRRQALETVGHFDERFFMYFEDTDLCRRFKEKEWRVVYHPEAEIIHNHTRHSAQDPWYRFFVNKQARHHIYSWVKYMQKWGI